MSYSELLVLCEYNLGRLINRVRVNAFISNSDTFPRVSKELFLEVIRPNDKHVFLINNN